MADPVLDEPNILATLDCRCCADNVSRLQAAALMSLVDAYDRKLERDAFVVLAHVALQLHTQTGKLTMIVSTAEHYRAGALDDRMLAQALAVCSTTSEKAHNQLRGLMERVTMCPTSADTVN